MVPTKIAMRRVITGCREACFPYRVNKERNGWLAESTGGSVVLHDF